jgi:predicted Zn-dependent protease
MPRRRITSSRLERWLRGQAELSEALGLSAADRDELARQARRRLEAGAVAEAERLFGLLSLLCPGSTVARLGQGACHQALGALEQARSVYDEVLQAEPDNVYALANRAEVLLLLRRVAPARNDLDAARARLGPRGGPAALRRRVERLRKLAEETDR